jgi:hypothetical protein
MTGYNNNIDSSKKTIERQREQFQAEYNERKKGK